MTHGYFSAEKFCDPGSAPSCLRLSHPSFFPIRRSTQKPFRLLRRSWRKERDSVIGLRLLAQPTTLPPSPSLSPAFSSPLFSTSVLTETCSVRTAVAGHLVLEPFSVKPSNAILALFRDSNRRVSTAPYFPYSGSSS